MKKLFCCAVVLAALGVQTASGQDVVQGPYGPGGTWNIYELGDDVLTWAEALEDARSKTREGVTGDLASIHSLEENQVVTDLALNSIVWIGATDREGTAPIVEQNGYLSPQESIQLDEEEFLGAENVQAAKFPGWAWTSGEPFCYHNWAGGEPNNWDGTAAGEAEIGFEDATFIRTDGLWNDAPGGYAEDEPVVPTLQPGTSTEELDGLPNERLYEYVIEYRTNSPTPFPGIDEVGDEPFLEEGCEPIVVNPEVPCDFDGDGSLGVGDIDALAMEIQAGTNNGAMDLTGDGSVDAADLTAFVTGEDKLHTWIGDANFDGEFNSSDFVAVFQAGLFETGNAATWSTGDWNGDGVFNSGDFVVAFQDGGFELGPRWTEGVANVPEPSAILLILIAIVGLVRIRRR